MRFSAIVSTILVATAVSAVVVPEQENTGLQAREAEPNNIWGTLFRVAGRRRRRPGRNEGKRPRPEPEPWSPGSNGSPPPSAGPSSPRRGPKQRRATEGFFKGKLAGKVKQMEEMD